MQPEMARDTSDWSTIDRGRAERRRAIARSANGQRERRRSSPAISSGFDLELLRHYATTRAAANFAMPFLVILVALVGTAWLAPATMTGWAVTALLAHAALAMIFARFMATPAEQVDLRSWHSVFIAAEFCNGLVWVALLLATAMVHGNGIEIFQFAIILTLLAVGTMLASSLPVASLAATAPLALTMVVLFAVRQDYLYLALSFLSVGSEIVFLALSQRLYEATLGTIRLRAEKDQLIADLLTAKSISDESRRRAEEANLAKSRFLATMSHELRTPLNAILGFSEVMKNEVLGKIQNENYRGYAADIHTSGVHLLDLINEILDLSRIEAGRYQLDEEPVALVDIIDDCENLMRLKARAKHLRIAQDFEQDLPRLLADERAVRQVVLNLLSNAIKFSQDGGSIAISAGWTAGGGQYVSILDNGPGIAEEEMPVVMSAFGQGTVAIKSAEQGAGLGLPIVQAMMRMHQGTFELRSTLGEGTEAIACFPHARVLDDDVHLSTVDIAISLDDARRTAG